MFGKEILPTKGKREGNMGVPKCKHQGRLQHGGSGSPRPLPSANGGEGGKICPLERRRSGILSVLYYNKCSQSRLFWPYGSPNNKSFPLGRTIDKIDYANKTTFFRFGLLLLNKGNFL